MKAIVYHNYGSPDVLQLEEVEQPVPKDDEVLIKVRAAALNAANWHLLRGDPFIARLFFGLFKPKDKILGADVAGRVEAVGRNVTQFQPGDEVFGDLSECGRGSSAEYVCAREDALVLKPASMTFDSSRYLPIYQQGAEGEPVLPLLGAFPGEVPPRPARRAPSRRCDSKNNFSLTTFKDVAETLARPIGHPAPATGHWQT
jgi:hypothetical protein